MADWTSLKRKWWLAIPGTLLLGALGSGLWDIGVKPAGGWMWRGLLTLLTLGSESMKNAIYVEAARGYHEHPALDILVAFVVLYLFASVSFPLFIWREVGRMERKLRSTEEEDDVEKLRTKVLSGIRLLRRSLMLLSFILIFFVGLRTTSLVKLMVANEAVITFQQSLAICRPFIDQHSADMILSEYARIETKAQYVAVLDKLKAIAVRNNITLGPYSEW